MVNSIITIGISDMQAAKSPHSFVTYALGSCVGICLYDPAAKIGSLGHIMLPSYPAERPNDQTLRYADTCIPLMVQRMEKMGALRKNITAKIAGGAKMFEVMDDAAFGNIGERNSTAVKAVLSQLRIPVIAEDLGKNFGRTVYFYTDTGLMVVKSFAQGSKTF